MESRIFYLLAALLGLFPWAKAEMFVLPTPNKAIFRSGGEGQYFVPTPGRTWLSGTFGCVRTDGWQMHEGLDIKWTSRDKNGEATDAIYASASGRVAYINPTVGLSNYGRYLVLEHQIEGLRVYTMYAHLSAFASGLRAGDAVRQGQVIGTMGRSSNTRQAISKERAHLHFEIDVRLSDRYAAWHKMWKKGQRNDHGNWNGKNFIGLDPRAILLEQQKLGEKFSLLAFIRGRTELCRVLVRDTGFSFLRDYTPLVVRNARAEREGVAGYEVSLDFNGVPFRIVPRSEGEIGKGPRLQVLSVNEREQTQRPCRKLVTRRGGTWELGQNGREILELMAH